MTSARKHELATFFNTMKDKIVSVSLINGYRIDGTITGVNAKQGILPVKENTEEGLIFMIPFEQVVYVVKR